MLNMSKFAIQEHLVKLGNINRIGVWDPHDLTYKNLMDCISICDSLCKRNEDPEFLKQVVIGDGKWAIFSNPKGWASSKEVHALCLLGLERDPYYQLLPNKEMINYAKYCFQFYELQIAIEQKCLETANRNGIVFDQDNAWLRVSDNSAKSC